MRITRFWQPANSKTEVGVQSPALLRVCVARRQRACDQFQAFPNSTMQVLIARQLES